MNVTRIIGSITWHLKWWCTAWFPSHPLITVVTAADNWTYHVDDDVDDDDDNDIDDDIHDGDDNDDDNDDDVWWSWWCMMMYDDDDDDDLSLPG